MTSLLRVLGLVSVVAALGLTAASSPVTATVVMSPGPQPHHVEAGLEQAIGERFGAAAMRQARGASTSIMVGTAAQRTWRIAPANLLIRTQKGWTSWQRGSARPLDPAVGAELDHLLSLPAFWREQAFAEVADCSSGARVAVIRHRARLRIDRQPCVPKGLRGRLAELAASERLPRGSKPFPADAQEWNRWTLTNEDSETIFELTNQSAWAWQRGELEIHLAPYAEDVTMVWPTGIEEGKEALRRRARAAQTWSKQYNPRELGVRLQKLHQAGPLSALQTSNFFFVGGDKPPTHYWVTSLWYKRRGEWEIVYEQVGAEMPDRLR